MVEVAPRSTPLRIHYRSCLLIIFILFLLLLALLYSIFGTSWGASNSFTEPFRRYLSVLNRFRPNTKPEDNLKSALRIHRVEKLSEKRYAMFFSITDSNSEPVLSIQPSEITIQASDIGMSRKPAIIEKLTPLHIANHLSNDRLFFSGIMDYSGSMFKEDIENIKKYYSGLINGVLFPFKANVFKFSSSVDEITSFTGDKTKLETSVCDSYPIGDSTALYDAMDKGLSSVQSQPNLRLLIVTTDGNDNASSIVQNEILRRMKAHSVSAFMLGFGWLKVETLKKISEETDGYFIYTPQSSDLNTWFPKIAKIINNVYVAEFTAQKELSIPCSVELTVNHAGITMSRVK
ncbi:MAG: VWA domain-containing protein [Candidatus Riflebacteria bacterium]|nr:VWA domain-containing protein [Candidatus Riflebacteria bacterium]